MTIRRVVGFAGAALLMLIVVCAVRTVRLEPYRVDSPPLSGSDTTLAPILPMGHLDVVPVEPGTESCWKHPPFAGVVADSFVWAEELSMTKPPSARSARRSNG